MFRNKVDVPIKFIDYKFANDEAQANAVGVDFLVFVFDILNHIFGIFQVLRVLMNMLF